MKVFPLLALTLITLAPSSAWASPASDEADIANSLARQGCYDTAVMFYEKALRLNPNYGPAIAGRAAALKKLAKGGKSKKGKNEDFVAPSSAATKAAREKEVAAAKAAETAARNAENAARAKMQEENAARRAAQIAANEAKAKAQAEAAAAAAAAGKTTTASLNGKNKPGAKKSSLAAAKAKTETKPRVAVDVAKPIGKAVVENAKPKPAVTDAARAKPPAVATAKPKAEPKAALVAAAVAPVAEPKPAPAKPQAKPAEAKPRTIAQEDLAPASNPVSVASVPMSSSVPADPVSQPAQLQPVAVQQADQAPVKDQFDATHGSTNSTDASSAGSGSATTSIASSAIPSSVGSAPPVSSLSDSSSHAVADKVPTWLYGMAAGTFLLLIVLAIWWLSPTLMASRQLQNRLKGLERTRDER